MTDDWLNQILDSAISPVGSDHQAALGVDHTATHPHTNQSWDTSGREETSTLHTHGEFHHSSELGSSLDGHGGVNSFGGADYFHSFEPHLPDAAPWHSYETVLHSAPESSSSTLSSDLGDTASSQDTGFQSDWGSGAIDLSPGNDTSHTNEMQHTPSPGTWDHSQTSYPDLSLSTTPDPGHHTLASAGHAVTFHSSTSSSCTYTTINDRGFIYKHTPDGHSQYEGYVKGRTVWNSSHYELGYGGRDGKVYDHDDHVVGSVDSCGNVYNAVGEKVSHTTKGVVGAAVYLLTVYYGGVR